MQGVHLFDPRAKMAIDLESFVEDDHVLRKIDGLLGAAFVRQLTAGCYAERIGRPSIDPEVFFRMELVAYLYGITSDRRLCEEVRYNLAYRWFCHLSVNDDVPDHSSLTRIRDRFGEVHPFYGTLARETSFWDSGPEGYAMIRVMAVMARVRNDS